MEENRVRELVFSGDPKKMNWFREDFPYAEVKCPAEFSWKVSHSRQGDDLVTEFTIKNEGKHSYFTNRGSIAISFPLADTYTEGEKCLDYRCHAHIFCGENTSYIMALRMGGEAPHLGMVLTEGSLSGYSVERDTSKSSNDRGCFWLHPSAKEFAPGEEMHISWKIFPHSGKEDFKEKAKKFPSVIWVESEHYVLYPGERTRVWIRPPFGAEEIFVNGEKAAVNCDGEAVYEFISETLGEYILSVEAGGRKTRCRLLVQKHPKQLAEKRCKFIVEHQQYHGTIRELHGAYLAYDTEEKHQVYLPEHDFNAGRERMGMGVLMAKYLCMEGVNGHEKEEKSLREYREYVLRELVDAKTGLVCDDTGRDKSCFRLYDYPWATTFFIECWRLWKQEDDLEIAYRTMKKFYQDGGYRFYPVETPVAALFQELKNAGKYEKMEAVKEMFQKHADRLLLAGTNYPAHEVNYEQSIVSPAANILLQVYEITGEEKYLDGGHRQLEVLELFNGFQPDYHLHEVAIRHWDGYWFGKRRLYGDTFPHYWSSQTGKAFRLYARLTGDPVYAKRAEDSLRGVLSMFFDDGTATCAYLFPYTINGKLGEYADPYANDQDWGLWANLE